MGWAETVESATSERRKGRRESVLMVDRVRPLSGPCPVDGGDDIHGYAAFREHLSR